MGGHLIGSVVAGVVIGIIAVLIGMSMAHQLFLVPVTATIQFGFSMLGVILLVMSFVPSIIWGRRMRAHETKTEARAKG